jgi:predicted Fe-S protein YdhL (DUF1289 family)
MISSPCIKICLFDPQAQLCTGCGRSLDEIARWGGMSETQRLETMRTLPERMRTAGLRPQQETTP